MKKSELKKLIKEEISKSLKEEKLDWKMGDYTPIPDMEIDKIYVFKSGGEYQYLGYDRESLNHIFRQYSYDRNAKTFYYLKDEELEEFLDETN